MPLPPPPDSVLWGLDDGWVGTRRRGGVSTRDEWLSYSLIHYRGKRGHPASPVLIVDHNFDESHERRILVHLAATAMMIYASEDPDSEVSQRVEAQAGRDVLGPEWNATTLELGRRSAEAFRRDVHDGFCLIASASGGALAVYARGFAEPLQLVERPDFMTAYTGEP